MPSSHILRTLGIHRPALIVTSRSTVLQTSRRALSGVDSDFDKKKKSQEDTSGIDRQSDENALSGTDDAVAQDHATSFDTSQSPTPENARRSAGHLNENNPLGVSGANPEISKGSDEEINHVARKPEPETKSYQGSTKKVKEKMKGSLEDKDVQTMRAGHVKGKADSPQDVARKGGIFPPGSR